MLRRINWDQGLDDDQLPNNCYLVWQGMAAEPLFGEFKIENCPSEVGVRDTLEEVGGI